MTGSESSWLRTAHSCFPLLDSVSSIARETEEAKARISARNILKGKVSKVTPGAVNSEVTVVLPNGIQIVSVITRSSAKSLGLKKGKDVYAVMKASSVMIAVD